MKIVSIGDIHGRPYWKDIDPSKYDKIIFNGDYMDSYVYTPEKTLQNLMDIIEFRKNNPDKVVNLLGNHDIQYMWSYDEFGCSGFKPGIYPSAHELFNENKDLFTVAFQIDKHIWTHAGITKGWYDTNKKILDEYANKFLINDNKSIDGLEVKPEVKLADLLNLIMWTKDNEILHQVGYLRGGIYDWGGITWADKKETMTKYLPGYHQIVGHTPVEWIDKIGDETSSITYIDVLRKYLDKHTDQLPLWKFFYELEL